jgi:hypothetical protein
MERQDRLPDSLPDSLDALLSSQPSARARWSLPESQREELEPLLDLAGDLALVRNVLPASTFADDLEARLLARARRHAIGAVSILEDDAGDVDTDADYAPTIPAIPALAIPDRPSRGASRPAPGSRRVSWRVWTSLAAIILLALTITTFTVAANASPGSALYGVRRWQEDARTNLAMSDADRAKLHIQYATDALDALDAAVAQHAEAHVYDEALGRFTDELRQANEALALVPAGGDHDTVSVSLENLRARGRRDLRAALPSLDWPGRITTTSALGSLGEPVLTLTQVSGVRSSVPGGHIWTITITGSGFQNGALLLVRQQPTGHVVSVTSTQMVAQLTAGEDNSLPHDIGVGNPDNTAATTTYIASEHENDDDTPRATGTPGGNHGSGECENESHSDDPPCTPTPGH